MAFKHKRTFERDGKGIQELKLEPDPQVPDPKDITFGLIEECCFYLQIDAETLLFTDQDIELPDHPPLMHAQAFIDTFVLNSDEYNIKKMHPAEVKSLIAALTAYFIKASERL
jgi:hypothetical protein